MRALRRHEAGVAEAIAALVASTLFVIALFLTSGRSSTALAPGYLLREQLLALGLTLGRASVLPLTIPPWWLVFFLLFVLIRNRDGT